MLFFVLLFIAAGCGNEVNQEPKAETAGYTAQHELGSTNLTVVPQKIEVLEFSYMVPDLIIADPARHKDIQAKLNDIAPTIYIKTSSSNYQEILDAYVC